MSNGLFQLHYMVVSVVLSIQEGRLDSVGFPEDSAPLPAARSSEVFQKRKDPHEPRGI